MPITYTVALPIPLHLNCCSSCASPPLLQLFLFLSTSTAALHVPLHLNCISSCPSPCHLQLCLYVLSCRLSPIQLSTVPGISLNFSLSLSSYSTCSPSINQLINKMGMLKQWQILTGIGERTWKFIFKCSSQLCLQTGSSWKLSFCKKCEEQANYRWQSNIPSAGHLTPTLPVPIM